MPRLIKYKSIYSESELKKNCPTFEVYVVSVLYGSEHFFIKAKNSKYIDINKIGLFDLNNRNSRLSC